jgi:hypothetical protein
MKRKGQIMPDKSGMQKSLGELIREKEQRFNRTIALEIPDRIPF